MENAIWSTIHFIETSELWALDLNKYANIIDPLMSSVLKKGTTTSVELDSDAIECTSEQGVHCCILFSKFCKRHNRDKLNHMSIKLKIDPTYGEIEESTEQ